MENDRVQSHQDAQSDYWTTADLLVLLTLVVK